VTQEVGAPRVIGGAAPPVAPVRDPAVPDPAVPDPAGWVVTGGAAGVVLIVLAYVTTQHYLQIEWHVSYPVPVAWWVTAELAAVAGVALFFVAAGACAEQLGHWTQVVSYAGLFLLSLLAGTAVLVRLNPSFSYAPTRDLSDVVAHLLLPPPGLALPYAMVVFLILARLTRRVPSALVLGVAAAVAIAAAAVAPRVPALANGAPIGAGLLFFAVGWRGRAMLQRFAGAASIRRLLVAGAGFAIACGLLIAGGAMLAWIRPLAAGAAALPFALAVMSRGAPAVTRAAGVLHRAALPIAAVLLPVTAFADAFLLRRLSALAGPTQLIVAVAEPAMMTAVVVGSGLVLHAVVVRLVKLATAVARPAAAER
jgi:hypothetical protein